DDYSKLNALKKRKNNGTRKAASICFETAPKKLDTFLGAFFMIKKKRHSFEFKLSCVKQMDEHYRSAKSLGEEFGITYSLFETWYRIYKHHGASGLLPKKGKRIFSPSFKLEVLKTIREENLSL